MTKKYLYFLFILIFVTSCHSKGSEQLSCESLISSEMITKANTDLRITYVDKRVVYDDLYELIIVVDNLSDKVLHLSPDSNLRVYFLKDSTWIQQKNTLDYPEFLNQIGVKSVDNPSGQLYSFYFDPSALGSSKDICITITATNDPEAETGLVGSFYQININP